METKKITKKQNGNPSKITNNEQQKPKSKIALFREKYPYGLGYEILDLKAVLR